MKPFAAILCFAVGIASASVASADPLGRLFFTPERRAALERQRQLNIEQTPVIEGATVSLNGVVTRSSGKTTVWINQRPQHEDATGTGVATAVTPGNPGQATIVPGEDAAATLKVGESVNRATHETTDPLGDGHIVVKRSSDRR